MTPRPFRRVGFTRHGCLIHKEVTGFQDQTISGNGVAGIQEDDVSRDDIFQGNFLLRPVTKHRGLVLDDGQELCHRISGAPFLPEAEEAADQDDHQNDTGVHGITEEERQPCRKYESEDDRAFKMGKQQGQDIGPRLTHLLRAQNQGFDHTIEHPKFLYVLLHQWYAEERKRDFAAREQEKR